MNDTHTGQVFGSLRFGLLCYREAGIFKAASGAESPSGTENLGLRLTLLFVHLGLLACYNL